MAYKVVTFDYHTEQCFMLNLYLFYQGDGVVPKGVVYTMKWKFFTGCKSLFLLYFFSQGCKILNKCVPGGMCSTFIDIRVACQCTFRYITT